jgi:PPOX class probable F420-dependent enzyme
MPSVLTQEVTARLEAEQFGWLTTVAKSGQPVPKLIWFHFDGTALFLYTMPTGAKVAHIRRHPRVSLNLDSDGKGGGVLVIGGEATIDAEGVDPRQDAVYWAKFGELSDQIGLTDSMADYSMRIRISIDKVWTTPTA